MSILRDLQSKTRTAARVPVLRTCTHCLQEYELGITGVETGCDTCEGIIRHPNGMIDYAAMNGEIFIHHVEDTRG